VLNGCAAEWIEMLNEVLQGSVIDPLLFLICCLRIVRSSITLFADDTKIWNIVGSHI